MHISVNIINILCAIFCMNVLCAAFLYLHFGFIIFWHKNIGAKGTHKMLMKLTTDALCVRFERDINGLLIIFRGQSHNILDYILIY